MACKNILKDVRKRCLLSQSDFADAIGVSFSTVNRWENGRAIPNYKTLKKIKDKQATAVNIELKKKHIDKKFFTDMLLNEFFAGYENFLRQGFAYIENDYIKRCYFLGKKISVHTIDKNLDVTAKSINSAGELVYEYNGNRFILTAGDID